MQGLESNLPPRPPFLAPPLLSDMMISPPLSCWELLGLTLCLIAHHPCNGSSRSIVFLPLCNAHREEALPLIKTISLSLSLSLSLSQCDVFGTHPTLAFCSVLSFFLSLNKLEPNNTQKPDRQQQQRSEEWRDPMQQQAAIGI